MRKHDSRSMVPVLHGYISDWFNSLPEDIRDEILGKFFVAGGCIASLLRGEKPKDIDVYMTCPTAAETLVRYYVPGDLISLLQVKDGSVRLRFLGGLEYAPDPTEDRHCPVYMNETAVTLASGIQVIFKFVGSPEDVTQSFDFVHCTGYWVPEDRKATISSEAVESIRAQRLQYRSSDIKVHGTGH